jgi:hypothetical protein
MQRVGNRFSFLTTQICLNETALGGFAKLLDARMLCLYDDISCRLAKFNIMLFIRFAAIAEQT